MSQCDVTAWCHMTSLYDIDWTKALWNAQCERCNLTPWTLGVILFSLLTGRRPKTTTSTATPTMMPGLYEEDCNPVCGDESRLTSLTAIINFRTFDCTSFNHDRKPNIESCSGLRVFCRPPRYGSSFTYIVLNFNKIITQQHLNETYLRKHLNDAISPCKDKFGHVQLHWWVDGVISTFLYILSNL